MARRLVPVPVVTLVTLALFVLALFLAVPSLSGSDTVSSYDHAAACAPDAPGRSCRQAVPAVVADVGTWSVGNRGQSGSGYWITLEAKGDPALAKSLRFDSADWPALGIRKGDRITAIVWSGRVTRITSARGAADVFEALPPYPYALVAFALIFLAAGLVLGRAGRSRDLPAARAGVARASDRVAVPLFAVAVAVFFVERGTLTAIAVVVLGCAAQLGSLAAMAWSVPAVPAPVQRDLEHEDLVHWRLEQRRRHPGEMPRTIPGEIIEEETD